MVFHFKNSSSKVSINRIMTITIAQLKNAEPVLSKLMNQPLQVKTSFRFTKIIESVSKDLENFEKHRMQLFNKYGEQQPDNSSTISAGNIELFNQEMTSLLQETVEIPEIKFSLEDLGDIQISPADLMFFTPWLTDTE